MQLLSTKKLIKKTEKGTSPLQILLIITSCTLLFYCVDSVRVVYTSKRLKSVMESAGMSAIGFIRAGNYDQLFSELLRNGGADFPELNTVDKWKNAFLVSSKDTVSGITTLSFQVKYPYKTLFMGLFGFKDVELISNAKLAWSQFDKATAIATGVGYTCAIDIYKDAWCWGRREDALAVASDILPYKIELPIKLSRIFVGNLTACGISDDPIGSTKVYCWNQGLQPNWSLGLPAYYSELDGATDITLNSVTNCALKYNGDVYCWTRSGYNGELGNGTSREHNTSNESWIWPPHKVTISNVKHISGGYFHTCAINTSDEIYCWGDDLKGALGVGFFETYTRDYYTDTKDLAYMRPSINLISGFGQSLPVGPLKGISKPSQLSMCSQHRSMARTVDGRMFGWGLNDSHQLTVSNILYYADWNQKPMTSSPLLLKSPIVSEVICALTVSCITVVGDPHGLSCSGRNNNGLLGQGGFGKDVLTPAEQWESVKAYWYGALNAVSAQNENTLCVIDENLTPWCWGRNDYGSLGYGDPLESSDASISGTPRPIVKSKVLYGV
jgi:alpha-tubulin suppressor-like RCC1 family protein